MAPIVDASATAVPTSAVGDAHTWKSLGSAQLAAGNFREAVANYEEALRIRPDFVEAYNELGIAWHHLGEWARAEACYGQVIRLMPPSALGYFNLGTALRKQGKSVAAC